MEPLIRAMISVFITETDIGHEDGHYKILHTPSLAGQYQASIMIRSMGGLLAM